jgi:hypothetical protein
MQHVVESEDLMIMKTELWVNETLQSWMYAELLLAKNFDNYA